MNNFKYYLTLFSKSFSPFPYGTCMLSVYHRYLALEGIHLPFKAAFPSNPTLREYLVRGGLPVPDGVLTLSDKLYSNRLRPRPHAEKYFHTPRFAGGNQQ